MVHISLLHVGQLNCVLHSEKDCLYFLEYIPQYVCQYFFHVKG